MNIAEAKAAIGPNKLDFFDSESSSESSENNDGGLTMKIIPSNVKHIVKILKRPHRSPKNILLNIATKTGVEKMMTVLKLKMREELNNFISCKNLPITKLHVLESVE